MAQIKIDNKQYDEKDVLAINIGNKTYNMPLANCMPLKVLKKLTEDVDVETIMNILGNYIPENVLDELTVNDIKSIFESWSEASKEVSGLDVGK